MVHPIPSIDATNPPTSPERRACETTSHQPAAASQQQPASCSQPAKPASQPMLHPGIEASGLQPAGIDVSKLLIRGIQSVPTGWHRLAQAATGCQTFWHPQHQGGSQTCHKPIKYRRYGQLPSKSCWGGLSAALLATESVMGRLWDDHFMDLGHPPKFSRV